jgi:hypothetical protein
MAVEPTMTTDHVHTDSEAFAKCLRRYDCARDAAVSEEGSIRLLEEIADQIIDRAVPTP